MSVINKQLWDALRAANVPEDKAAVAAESVDKSGINNYSRERAGSYQCTSCNG